MDRRSKRSYYYEDDYATRSKHRHRHPIPPHPYPHRRPSVSRPPPPPPPAASPVSISYRILCPDARCSSVFGKSGAGLKTLREETRAWIEVRALVAGDEERVIEVSDGGGGGGREGYSPAEEALLVINERLVDAEAGDGGEEARMGRVAARMVVPMGIVGCLLGKGGKIVEQMREETRTQIRVLPREHKLPRCVSSSEEIVQVMGDSNAVKKAIAIIASRLKEAMLRKGGSFRGSLPSIDQHYHPDDDVDQRRSYGYESHASSTGDRMQVDSREELVFQILCPSTKVEALMADSCGLMQTLQVDVGVDVKVSDSVPGFEERIITISSDEGPDDELFPAQEALLHVQNHIVDVGSDKDKVLTTRLLVPGDEAVCLDAALSEMTKLSRANIQILTKEDIPPCALGSKELVQIVGNIVASREAVLQITSKIRTFVFHDSPSGRDSSTPPGLRQGQTGAGSETSSLSYARNLTRDHYQGIEPLSVETPNNPSAPTLKALKENGRSLDQMAEEAANVFSRIQARTKSTLEVSIPDHAVPSLSVKSGSKLVQISEMSGATVCFVEDVPDGTEKVIRISGMPEQTERAQSLLQGFILSTQ